MSWIESKEYSQAKQNEMRKWEVISNMLVLASILKTIADPSEFEF